MIGSIRAKLKWTNQEIVLPSEIEKNLKAMIRGRTGLFKEAYQFKPCL